MATIFQCNRCRCTCLLVTTTNDAPLPDQVCNWATDEGENAEWVKLPDNDE